MKAYKLEILIIDLDELGKEQMLEELARARFTNDCISLQVKDVVERDIGEWSDDHPLNKGETYKQAYLDLFKGASALPKDLPFRIKGPGIDSRNPPKYSTASAAHFDISNQAKQRGQHPSYFTVFEDLPDGSFRLA